jgi:hypothetical protein
MVLGDDDVIITPIKSKKWATQSVIPDSEITMQKPIFFLSAHTQRFLSELLSRIYNSSLKIKRSETDSKPFKTLAKL